MRWINFAILVFCLLVVQLGLGRLMGLGPQHIIPDLLLVVAIVLAFRGGNHRSLEACWILGLCRDFTSDAVLGSHALAFGLMGFLIIYLREWVFGEHPLAVMMVTFVAALAVSQNIFFINLFKGTMVFEDYATQSLEMMFSALFTAALTPYGQWGLRKLARPLGIERERAFG